MQKQKSSKGIKVLLCEDIDKIGWLGDVVEVSAGYARNYLLPQGMAIVPTEANLRSLADEKARRAEERIVNRKRLEKAAEEVEGAEAVIAATANEQGHLFGSVTAREIATNLREQGFEVADEIVQLREHIKDVGTRTVTLKFADDLTAKVSVVVVPEGEDLAAFKKAEQDMARSQVNEEEGLSAAAGDSAEAENPEQAGEENEPTDKDS
ncbi:MAG: 50S ribosomal protein L9 [Planctomycetota bacterium]|jgi:large subunit ribosomal protein L9